LYIHTVSERMLTWFHNFNTQRFCATKVENETSKYKQRSRGLPQEEEEEEEDEEEEGRRAAAGAAAPTPPP
jgi:hypothetical protein